MLKVLRDTIKNLYYPLQSQGNWNSAFIAKPFVQRIWTQMDDYRVSLNNIHPDTEVFYHPCPSAVLICRGECECFVGGDNSAYSAGPFYLSQWSSYELTNSRQNYFIRAVKEPVLTIMIIKNSQAAANSTHRVLTKQEFDPIFEFFKSSENRVKMLDVLDRWIEK